MSRFTARVTRFATFFLVTAVALSVPQLSAQVRRRRDTNANRRARIQREIQDTYSHRWEAAGGGGYLRFRSGEDLRRNNEVTFFGTATRFFDPKFGLLADVHGAYGNAKIGNTIYNLKDPQISEYTFTAGPAYRFYAAQHTAFSGFLTGGVAYGKFNSGSKGVPPELIGIWPAAWRAAFTAGVNLDYNFYPNLALRVAPTYVGTTFGGEVQNNLGFNLGLVYRFGRIQ